MDRHPSTLQNVSSGKHSVFLFYYFLYIVCNSSIKSWRLLWKSVYINCWLCLCGNNISSLNFDWLCTMGAGAQAGPPPGTNFTPNTPSVPGAAPWWENIGKAMNKSSAQVRTNAELWMTNAKTQAKHWKPPKGMPGTSSCFVKLVHLKSAVYVFMEKRTIITNFQCNQSVLYRSSGFCAFLQFTLKWTSSTHSPKLFGLLLQTFGCRYASWEVPGIEYCPCSQSRGAWLRHLNQMGDGHCSASNRSFTAVPPSSGTH